MSKQKTSRQECRLAARSGRPTLLAIVAIASAFGQQIEDHTTEHKSYSGVRELILDNVTGGIEVSASSGSSVEVDVDRTFRARSQDRLSLARKEIRLAETQEGGLVRLVVDH